MTHRLHKEKYMIRGLSILILALGLSTHVYVNAAEDPELSEAPEPSVKKAKVEVAQVAEAEKPEVAIDMSAQFRKDVVVKLDLSRNKYLTDINFVLAFPTITYLNLAFSFNLGNNYKYVSSLKSLRILNLTNIFSHEPKIELHHLCNLENLTSLDLSHNNLKKTIKYLSHLTKLET
jgi:hypothetical protein